MKVVLIRHATRAQSLGNPPLSTAGLAQAEELARLIDQGSLPTPSCLLCSPKKRTRQTLEPISLGSQVPLTVDARLEERHHNESMHDFEARIKETITEFSAQTSTKKSNPAQATYLCTHSDWLEIAMPLLPSDLSDLELCSPWATAEYKVFEIIDGFWSLKAKGIVTPKMELK